MERKATQYVRLKRDWVLWKLAEERWRACEKELDLYDRAHGFDWACDGDFRYDAYEHFCATDEEHKRRWAERVKASDEMRASLDRFCESMERFTGAQIPRDVARQIATGQIDALTLSERKPTPPSERAVPDGQARLEATA